MKKRANEESLCRGFMRNKKQEEANVVAAEFKQNDEEHRTT